MSCIAIYKQHIYKYKFTNIYYIKIINYKHFSCILLFQGRLNIFRDSYNWTHNVFKYNKYLYLKQLHITFKF